MINEALFLEKVYLNIGNYLINIDSTFFDELKTLIDACKKKIHNPTTTYDEFIEQLRIDEGLDYEELIKLTKDFFHSLDTSYERKFEDIILKKKIKFSRGKNIENSNESEMVLTGNYADVTTLAHESEHDFCESKDNKSIINAILCETDAICVEMLAIDYLKEKKNVNKYNIYDAREMDLIDSDFFSSRYIEAVINLFNNKKNGNTNLNNHVLELAKTIYPFFEDYDIKFEKIFKGMMYEIFRGFSHQIGYILANYIHEKIIEDPKNICMLKAVKQALDEEDEEKSIEILSKNEIPIIENGKISLSAESIETLVNYIDISNRRRRNLKPTEELIKESMDGLPDLSILSKIEEFQRKQTSNEIPKYRGDN